MQINDLAFRQADRNDLGQIAALFAQLGHKVTASTIEERWDACTRGRSGAIVAEAEGGQLAGLVTFGFSHVIHRDKPVGRIHALVVDDYVQDVVFPLIGREVSNNQ